jgi:hypothetical protein
MNFRKNLKEPSGVTLLLSLAKAGAKRAPIFLPCVKEKRPARGRAGLLVFDA